MSSCIGTEFCINVRQQALLVWKGTNRGRSIMGPYRSPCQRGNLATGITEVVPVKHQYILNHVA
jgi:hypothetical protein